MKYLKVIFDETLKLNFYISTCAKNLPGTFHIRESRQVKVKQNTVCRFAKQSFFQSFRTVLLLLSHICSRKTLKFSTGDCQVSAMCLSLNCEQHLSACEQFSPKTISNATHPLGGDLSDVGSHISTRSAFRPIKDRIQIYRTSTVSYLVRILTNRDYVSAES